MILRVAAVLIAATMPVVSAAQCVLSGPDIVNTTDPSCANRMFTYTEVATGPDQIPLGIPVPIPVSSLTPVDGFRTYDSLLAAQQDLALTDANVAATQVGSTLAGRPIWAYAIGDADNATVDGLTEPAVMVVGGTHAREWQPPEVVANYIEVFAANAADDGLGAFLNDNLNVVIIPVLNVDGFLQTQAHPDRVSADTQQPREGRMRRRNLRNPNTGLPIDDTIATPADNFFGVDLNRNSPQGWGLNGGSQSSPTSMVFRGPAASSEPEIQALQQAILLAPGDRLRLYMDIHSFTQVYIAPSTGNPRRDAYSQQLAERMRAVQNFSYRYTADPPNGGIGLTSDYFAYTFEIPSWTLETEPTNGLQQYGGTAGHIASGFILPDAEIARVRDELTASFIVGAYRQAGPPYVVAARITDADSGEVRFAAEWGNGPQRTLNVTTNQALVPAGNYRLWLAFSKPMRWQNGGAVATYPGQQTTPMSGSVELQVPSLDANDDVTLDIASIVWHDQPDGMSDGYRRYIYDAASIDFSLPADMPATDPIPAVLQLSFADLADFQLDADPATTVDWQNGAWTNFENENDVAGDSGGIDCQMRPFVAADPMAAAPANAIACRAVSVTPPPPPPPPPVDPPRRGGGGALVWLLLLLIPAYAIRVGARR